MYDILDVVTNLNEIYENNTSLSVLKDMERVFDQLDMYVYENWMDGELAYGPQVDRHWITAGFMWPHDKMPNPIAGKRLTDLGCNVKYERSHLIEPRKIKTQEDYRPGTKKGKLDHKPIWIVEVQMPRRVAFDIYRGYMDKMKNENQQNTGPKDTTSVPSQAAPVAPPMPGGAGMPATGGMPAPGGMPPAV